MNNICKICNQPIESARHFYTNHKIKEKSYYETYYGFKDKLTNELIEFKSVDNYFLTDFVSRVNLKKYLESISKEEGLEYLKSWLKRRKDIKDIIYAPGEFECRSLLFPSIKFINSFYGNGVYEFICNESGLIVKYNYKQELKIDNNKELNFIVDSREQSLLDVPNKQIGKLDVGDYTVTGSNIIIERKSLTDFCGTLSKGFDRFCRELDRCRENDNYLIILMEEKFNNINSLKYLPHTKRIKATPEFILYRARKISVDYADICQIVCVDGRKNAVEFIEKIYKLENNIKTIDFQYIIDSKGLR